ncbi:MAG: hypothetical protein JRJ59_06525 [Deltaproteobacteria bacterium]|nr:hypothetical protein [Deltaproteobacteria bacterium]
MPPEADQPGLSFEGVVEGDRPASFVPFPFCKSALMQVADRNLEFFHLRFLLACLMRGVGQNLFACLVDGQILGLVFIVLKGKLFFKGLEIKFIAAYQGHEIGHGV